MTSKRYINQDDLYDAATGKLCDEAYTGELCGVEFVKASDYDALAAELDKTMVLHGQTIAECSGYVHRIRELEDERKTWLHVEANEAWFACLKCGLAARRPRDSITFTCKHCNGADPGIGVQGRLNEIEAMLEAHLMQFLENHKYDAPPPDTFAEAIQKWLIKGQRERAMARTAP
jgi:hypothetical protein